MGRAEVARVRQGARPLQAPPHRLRERADAAAELWGRHAPAREDLRGAPVERAHALGRRHLRLSEAHELAPLPEGQERGHERRDAERREAVDAVEEPLVGLDPGDELRRHLAGEDLLRDGEGALVVGERAVPLGVRHEPPPLVLVVHVHVHLDVGEPRLAQLAEPDLVHGRLDHRADVERLGEPSQPSPDRVEHLDVRARALVAARERPGVDGERAAPLVGAELGERGLDRLRHRVEPARVLDEDLRLLVAPRDAAEAARLALLVVEAAPRRPDDEAVVAGEVHEREPAVRDLLDVANLLVVLLAGRVLAARGDGARHALVDEDGVAVLAPVRVPLAAEEPGPAVERHLGEVLPVLEHVVAAVHVAQLERRALPVARERERAGDVVAEPGERDGVVALLVQLRLQGRRDLDAVPLDPDLPLHDVQAHALFSSRPVVTTDGAGPAPAAEAVALSTPRPPWSLCRSHAAFAPSVARFSSAAASRSTSPGSRP